ncbi:histidine kinase/DNA gyrase B/HSP90-like ATPase [Ureibacillus xyleni]|uniref:histidine kinase n=1 Tax=Ureibacillus xyleni TaxID=614648 RepID=A0A285SWY4_9BACL|nr:HAMP domain-containing sensor histidine kinase [Ureibacillus xyleni]SOC10933.1 histidine kinase/DNA gyrase B/HSP90-like ATPase [Ureibacillus xyleni]
MGLKGKSLLSLFLITWVVFSSVLFILNAHRYIGNNFFESDNFQVTKEDFKQQLGRFVLQPFDEEKAKASITVTQDEIDYHRNYYGTLSEQVANIRDQYSDRIFQAEESKDAQLKEILMAERDAKIADIKENFADDEHVEEKIRKQKEQIIEEFAKAEKLAAKDFLNNFGYFTYSLVNVNTGEKFESANITKSNTFSESYGNQKPYFNVNNQFYIGAGDGYYDSVALINQMEINYETVQFEGVISIPKSMLNATIFATEYRAFSVTKIILYIIWATGILAIAGLFTFAKPSFEQYKNTSRLKELFLRVPIDVRIVIIFISALFAYISVEQINNLISITGYYQNLAPHLLEILFDFVVLFMLVTVVVLGVFWIKDSFNQEQKFKQELKSAFLYKLADGIQDLFINRSIGIQSVVILIITFLSGVGFVGGMMDGDDLLAIYVVLLFFIGLPACIIFLRRMGYLNRIMKQTKEMAEGRLTTPIKVKGKSPFAKHAENLNHLREGVRKSLTEQAKSERLKTELITNVSHDLRTPLTSIITYTDLLKNSNITEEERNKYIDVLDKKSARLKTLIEDLFEVSKMASGNMELNKQRIDLTQLMQQAVGEHEEAFLNANLDLRITKPDVPLYANVDGQKWWRVLDNLVVNALKYSLEGTRVYVTLTQKGMDAEFTVKNITKYELGENVEELTERFKRADASRHTDGSGLGLAIAQSIVDMHNGRLQIDVDGDLFKVTLTVPID